MAGSWPVKGISEIKTNLGKVIRDSDSAMLLGAGYFAARIETRAKREAKWTDRTSNARNGLIGSYEVTGSGARVALAHSMEYGVYLELAHGAKYAIILPTLTAEAPNFPKAIQQAMKGLGL